MLQNIKIKLKLYSKRLIDKYSKKGYPNVERYFREQKT